MLSFVREVLNVAEKEVWVRETGQNRGSRVEEYLRSVGLSPGNPWCCAMVYWCIDQVARQHKAVNPLPRTGYCPYLQSWADGAGHLREEPEPGDIFLLVGKTAAGTVRAHHAGFVVGTDGEQFGTIEGNTNLNGSAEGIGVFRRGREVGPMYQFVRWADALTLAPPAPYKLNFNGKVVDVPVEARSEGHGWIGVRAFGGLLGKAVTWDQEAQAVRLNGTLLPVELAVEKGTAKAPIRDLVEALGGRCSFDPATKTVYVAVKAC